jgi:transcriptional regulator with XRE-family HTH domain
MMSEDVQSPTDYKLQLGEVLAEHRLHAKKSRKDAALQLHCSEAKIGTIERGRSAMTHSELEKLLDLFGVAGEERSAIEELAAAARQRRPPTPWGAAVPARLQRFFRVEETAKVVRDYHPELVHGLAQTEDYARAVVGFNIVKPAEVDKLVQARMARQARLEGPQPVRPTLVLPEAALRLTIGSPKVMRHQLRHLVDLVDQGKADVRVIQASAGMHPARGFPFTILTPPGRRRTVVYLENLTDGIFVDDEERVEKYEAAFAQMLDVALSTRDTVTLLATVAAEV